MREWRFRGVVLVTAVVVAVGALTAALVLRSWAVSRTDRRLCGAIHNIVAGGAASIGKPGTPGYDYYRHHPDELRAAHRANAATLRKLDCDHLPTGG